MSSAQEAWAVYVARGLDDSGVLVESITGLIRESLGRDSLCELSYIGFSIAAQSLMLGARDVAELAASIESVLSEMYEGKVDVGQALPLLSSGSDALHAAFVEYANADESGARIEGTPLRAASYELQTLLPVPGKAPPAAVGLDVRAESLVRRKASSAASEAPKEIQTAPPEPSSSSDAPWAPDVDEEMLELFFEEVGDRIESVSQKLLALEQSPTDLELIRGIFRDWHTLKGSAAMVDLRAIADIAHAAEDLVGQMRDGKLSASKVIVDAQLAALDRLRVVASTARDRKISLATPADLLRRLRSPDTVIAEASEAAPEVADQIAIASASTEKAASSRSRQTIRVDFDKLDGLLNLVGELVLGRDGLTHGIFALSSLTGELGAGQPLRRMAKADNVAVERRKTHRVAEELSRLERVLVDIHQELDTATLRLGTISSDLRDSVMGLRMVPVGGVLRKHVRTVRDLSAALGKNARLELLGEDVELDKLLVEALDEPLMHLVRNALDHGIEGPEERIAAGKDQEGRLVISAQHVGGEVVIEIRDDGRGIDANTLRAKAVQRELISEEVAMGLSEAEALDLIFHSGFSTAKAVSEVSGRGVGMDVVRQTIVRDLKGRIDIESQVGTGSTIRLRMPLTLAIAQVLLIGSGGDIFAIPLSSVSRTLVMDGSDLIRVRNREHVLVAGEHIPLFRLSETLGLDQSSQYTADKLNLVICEQGGRSYALAVETLIEKREIVSKSLGEVLQEVPCVAGATLVGDRCAVILDVPAIIERALHLRTTPIVSQKPAATSAARSTQKRILLAEDSETVRETLRRLLVEAGYAVDVAVDGLEALELAQKHQYDLVSTDVMMPRMDGYDLTRALRRSESYRDTPILMVTSRGERIDRVRGFDAGVDEYITKPHDRIRLVRAVAKLLGADS